MTDTKCTECGGNGLVKCTECHGTGLVHSHNPKCWGCNGTGQTKCTKCKGTGQIEAETSKVVLYVDDKFCIFRKMKATSYVVGKVCSLTQNVLAVDDPIYLIINNYALFPNCMVLAAEADKIGLAEVMSRFIKEWGEAQKYKHWFV